MKPTIGQIVHYRISDYDAQEINRRRTDAGAFTRTLAGSINPGEHGRTGHVLHSGNSVSEGQVYPAFVVATFGGTSANLHVLLDGNDTFWATSRTEGSEPGQWYRPEHEDR